MSFSYATVVDARPVGSRFRRITLRVDEPDVLEVSAAADSAVGVYFPDPEPDPGADGSLIDPAVAEGRNYSVRRQRGDRLDHLDLDVLLHAHGPGTTWAAGARVGDRVGLDHARSWYRPPADCAWQLVVTDLAGLPATARIIEDLPGGVPVTVLAEVADHDDIAYLPSHPDVTLLTTVGSGNGHAPSRLAQLVGDFPPPAGRGYCWFAGEAAESRTVRKHLRGMGWTVDQLDVTGYWRFDSETWDVRYAAVADDVEGVYTRALADGKGDKVAAEEFDEALERAGL